MKSPRNHFSVVHWLALPVFLLCFATPIRNASANVIIYEYVCPPPDYITSYDVAKLYASDITVYFGSDIPAGDVGFRIAINGDPEQGYTEYKAYCDGHANTTTASAITFGQPLSIYGNSATFDIQEVFGLSVAFSGSATITFGGTLAICRPDWEEVHVPLTVRIGETYTAVSRKVHGTAGTFDVNLPLTGARGVECRSGGANHNFSIVFTFSDNITGVDNTTVSPSTCAAVSSTSLGPNGNQYTVNLTSVCNAQYVTVSLSGIHYGAGGTTTSASATMGVLFGDTTANGAVSSSDIAQTQSQSGQLVSGNNFREDVTVNGAINSSDISAVQSASGTGLPTSP